MMREQDFILAHQAQWDWLNNVFEKGISGQDAVVFPERYRLLCEQLAFARAQGFSNDLVNRLNVLARQGYGVLYRKRRNLAGVVADYFLRDLPQAIYAERRWLWIATVLFVVSVVGGFLWQMLDAEAAARWGIETAMRRMYEPIQNAELGAARESDDDILMWGFYIWNNTTISLKAAAGGVFAGLLTAYVTIFNGVHLGLALGFTTQAGWVFETFLPFVITHGAFELTALVLAAAVGLALASALFFPKRLSRGASMRAAVARLLPILVAIILFDFIAAGFEAFWSPRVLPPSFKFVVGGAMWVLVLGYFCFGHRLSQGMRDE